jgi:hypothetical protein
MVTWPNGRVRFGRVNQDGRPSRLGSVGRKASCIGARSEHLELEYMKGHTRAVLLNIVLLSITQHCAPVGGTWGVYQYLHASCDIRHSLQELISSMELVLGSYSYFGNCHLFLQTTHVSFLLFYSVIFWFSKSSPE